MTAPAQKGTLAYLKGRRQRFITHEREFEDYRLYRMALHLADDAIEMLDVQHRILREWAESWKTASSRGSAVHEVMLNLEDLLKEIEL